MIDEASRSEDREKRIFTDNTIEHRSHSRRQFMNGALGVAGASLGSGLLVSASESKNFGERAVDVQPRQKIEAKLQALGLVLPQQFKVEGMTLPQGLNRARNSYTHRVG